MPAPPVASSVMRARKRSTHARAHVEHVGAERALGPGEASLARRQQVDAAVILEDRDARVGAHARQQRALDLAPGGVAVMDDTPPRVTALAPEIEACARASPGSKSAPSLSSASIIAGPRSTTMPHDVLAAQTAARP